MLKVKKGYEFYCLEESIFEINKVKPIKKQPTSWIIPKDVKPNLHDATFAHMCSGVRSLLKTGWVISAHFDIKINQESCGDLYVDWPEYCTSNERIRHVDFFTADEFTSFVPTLKGTNANILKLSTPWSVKCPKGWGLLLLPLQYHGDQKIYSSTGILNPEYSSQINPILFVHMGEGKNSTVIPQNTPLAHMIPVPLHYDDAKYRMATEKEQKWDAVYKEIINTKFKHSPKFVRELYNRYFNRR